MNYTSMSKKQLIKELLTAKEQVAKEVNRNKEQYQTLFQNAHIPYQFLNRRNQIIDVNQRWLHTLGYRKDEVLNEYFYEFIHPEHKSRYKKQFRTFLKNGEIHDFQFKLKHKNGHYIHVSLEGYISYDKQGNTKKIYCMFKDISNQKILENSLSQIESSHRNIIQASNNHIFMLTENGYYMLSNDKVNQFGFQKGSQLIGKSVSEVHSHEIGELYQGNIEEVIKTRETVTFEYLLYTKDRKHYHLDSLYPVIENNKLLGIGGICRDITERKLKHIALEEKEAELSTILKNVPVLLATIEKSNGRFKLAQISNQYSKSTNEQSVFIKNEQILNCLNNNDHVCYFGKECDNCQIVKLIQKTYENNRSFLQKEFQLLTKDNDEKWFLISTVPIEVKGDRQVLLSLLDITSRKTSEIQLYNTMKYLNNIEEEFRTKAAQQLHDHIGQNLTGLDLNLKFMYKQLPADSQNIIEEPYHDSKNLLNDTIKSIKNMISEMRPTILKNHGLYTTLEWYGNQIEKRTGMNVQVEGAKLSKRLNADLEATLFRIVEEVFNNILKHADAQNIVVNLIENKQNIDLQIEDDGIGFNINNDVGKQDSTGLGLLSMQDRVNALGGEFGLKSAPGKGTIVNIIMEKEHGN